MSKSTIKEILGDYKKLLHHDITVRGWVRAFRSNRFIALNDGSTIHNLQVVVDFENFDENLIKNIKTASSLKIVGEVIESEGKGQDIEVIAKKIVIFSTPRVHIVVGVAQYIFTLENRHSPVFL